MADPRPPDAITSVGVPGAVVSDSARYAIELYAGAPKPRTISKSARSPARPAAESVLVPLFCRLIRSASTVVLLGVVPALKLTMTRTWSTDVALRLRTVPQMCSLSATSAQVCGATARLWSGGLSASVAVTATACAWWYQDGRAKSSRYGDRSPLASVSAPV